MSNWIIQLLTCPTILYLEKYKQLLNLNNIQIRFHYIFLSILFVLSNCLKKNNGKHILFQCVIP